MEVKVMGEEEACGKQDVLQSLGEDGCAVTLKLLWSISSHIFPRCLYCAGEALWLPQIVRTWAKSFQTCSLSLEMTVCHYGWLRYVVVFVGSCIYSSKWFTSLTSFYCGPGNTLSLVHETTDPILWLYSRASCFLLKHALYCITDRLLRDETQLLEGRLSAFLFGVTAF